MNGSDQRRYERPHGMARPAALKAPRFVYRYLNDIEHARQMLQGKIMIATLESLRTADSGRADPNEGLMSYEVSQLNEWTPPAAARLIRDRILQTGVLGGDIDGVSIENITFENQANAFILCTTLRGGDKRMRERFGQHCVRIAEPRAFVMELSRAINEHAPLKGYAVRAVNYDGRSFSDLEPHPGHPVFANDKGNEYEREVRFVWEAINSQDVRPVLVDAPAAGRLCSLV